MLIETFGTSQQDALVSGPRFRKPAWIGERVDAGFAASGIHPNSRMLVLAGYLFADSFAFKNQWRVALAEFGISHAREVDCVMGNGQYRNMPLADRDRLSRSLIEQIAAQTLAGFSVSIDPQQFKVVAMEHGLPISVHGFLSYALLGLVAGHLEGSKLKEVSYHLTDDFDPSAFAAMSPCLYNSHWLYRELYRPKYLHSKRKAAEPILQAADILAYHTNHFHDRRLRLGINRPRAELTALMRSEDKLQFFGLDEISDMLTRLRPSLDNNVAPLIIVKPTPKVFHTPKGWLQVLKNLATR